MIRWEGPGAEELSEKEGGRLCGSGNKKYEEKAGVGEKKTERGMKIITREKN
jgi:hypothetical protein